MSDVNKYIRFDQAAANTEIVRGPTATELEHSLATTFITLQREKNPAERTRMWSECLRLAAEIEKMQ